uniref:DDE Tnp4 domain-containing protein n=1 Tax=Cannabis sativa TaxID=3483 RepID=A0A803P7M7_CANSA
MVVGVSLVQKSDNEVCHPFLDEFEFVMKSSDDEKDLAYGNYVPKEISFCPRLEFVPTAISEDPRFYPYFKDCVGAIDGIHVPVMVGVDEQGPFRNKNGSLSQIVLAACSFDLKFHYVLAGWEDDDLPQEESSPPPPLVELDQQPMKNVENSTGLDIHFDEEQIELSLQLRDSIATEMWNDYINDISSL